MHCVIRCLVYKLSVNVLMSHDCVVTCADCGHQSKGSCSWIGAFVIAKTVMDPSLGVAAELIQSTQGLARSLKDGLDHSSAQHRSVSTKASRNCEWAGSNV